MPVDHLRICPECGRPLNRIRGAAIAGRARWQCAGTPQHRFGTLDDSRSRLAALVPPSARAAGATRDA